MVWHNKRKNNIISQPIKTSLQIGAADRERESIHATHTQQSYLYECPKEDEENLHIPKFGRCKVSATTKSNFSH